MSFALYVLGYLIFIVGVALGAHYMHVPTHWIAVVVLIFSGLGVASAVSHTRRRDPS
jgi:positive regulator of sigma E activity